VYTPGSEIHAVSLSSKGEQVAALTRDGVLMFKGTKQIWKYDLANANGLATSSDGAYTVTSSSSEVYLLDKDGNQIWSFGMGSKVGDVSISSDGNYIGVVASYYVSLLDKTTQVIFKNITSAGAVATVVSVSQNGEYVAAGAGDNVYLFSRNGTMLLNQTSISSGTSNVLSIATTGNLTATGMSDNNFYGLTIEGGVWRYYIGTISSVHISPKGIAVGSRQSLYYYNSYGELQWSHDFASEVTGVSLSPEGRYISAGTKDGKVYIYDISSLLPVSISISTSPSVGDVYINGEHKGQSPVDVSLSPGTYTVRVTNATYGEWKRTYKFLGGEEESVEVNFTEQETSLVAEATQQVSAVSSDRSPAWSPDGSKIAFASNSSGNYDIFVMSADGTNRTQLTTSTSSDEHPTWSPDGTKIAFASMRSGNYDIWVMSADGSDQKQLTTNSQDDKEPAWCSNGKIAFSSSRSGNYDIWVMSADGSDQKSLTTGSEDEISPAWNADCTKIAFASMRSGNYDIWVMSADGIEKTNLTTDKDADLDPAWSPDGTKIAFSSARRGSYNIWVMNSDGSSQAILTSGTNDIEPSWNPKVTEAQSVATKTIIKTTEIAYTTDAGISMASIVQRTSMASAATTGTPTPTDAPPGFEAIFAVAGIMVMAYLLRRRSQ